MSQFLKIYNGVDFKDLEMYFNHVLSPSGNVIDNFEIEHLTNNHVSLIILYSGTKVTGADPVPNTSPIIYGVDDIEVAYHMDFNPLEGVTAYDKEEGDITSSISVKGEVEVLKPGTYTLEYTVTDKSGVSTVKRRNIKVKHAEDKYMIVCIAGQSNAHGFDEGPWYDTDLNPDPDRLKYLGYFDSNNLKLLPLEGCTETFQNIKQITTSPTGELGVKTSALPLGRALAQVIPSDYKLLFLPTVWGGGNLTGPNGDGVFDSKKLQPTVLTTQWSLRSTSSFITTIIERVRHSLELNPENKFLGFVWCQGESDPNASVATWSNAFLATTNRISSELNNYGLGDRCKHGIFDKRCWFIHESCPNYMQQQHMQDKFNWYETWVPGQLARIPNASTEVDSNLPTLPKHHHVAARDGKTHWGNDSMRRRVFPKLIEIMDSSGAFEGMHVPDSVKELIPGTGYIPSVSSEDPSNIKLALNNTYNLGKIHVSPLSYNANIQWYTDNNDAIELIPSAADNVDISIKSLGMPGTFKVYATCDVFPKLYEFTIIIN